MAEQDAMGDRRRAAEETYFQKKDRELIEKMRAAAASERARHEMSASTGLSDPEALRDLEELGFTPDTVALLPLVPIVRMAWIEGGVTPAERDKILEIARARGVLDGSVADVVRFRSSFAAVFFFGLCVVLVVDFLFFFFFLFRLLDLHSPSASSRSDP